MSCCAHVSVSAARALLQMHCTYQLIYNVTTEVFIYLYSKDNQFTVAELRGEKYTDSDNESHERDDGELGPGQP